MPYTTSTETMRSSIPNASLHPLVQASLENLDVDIEAELHRFRRRRQQQQRQRAIASLVEQRSAERSPLASPQPAIAPPPLLPEASSAPLLQPLPEPAPQPAIDLNAPLPPLPNDSANSDYFASSAELLRSLAEPIEQEPALLNTLLTPLGVGAMVLLLLSSATLGFAIMHPTTLASLLGLRQGDRPATEAASPTPSAPVAESASPQPNLAAPEFGGLDLNTLSQLPQQPSQGVQFPTMLPVPSTPVPSGTVPIYPQPPVALVPQPPTVYTPPVLPVAPVAPPVPVDQAPAPQTPVQPIASPSVAPVAPLTAAPTPQLPAPMPEPVTAAPAARPVQTPTPVAPEPEPEVAQAPAASDNSSRHYYVVTDYTGDPSLNQARQAVGDAYVQNFPDGAKVRLGVFSDESRAEEMIQSLQQQGIPARIYQP